MYSGRIKHLKKGDSVVALSGNVLGQSGTVLEVNQKKGIIQVEGLGTVKRHMKPTQSNPKGGVIEKLRWWNASKFQVCDSSGKGLGRVSFQMNGDKKERVFSKKKK